MKEQVIVITKNSMTRNIYHIKQEKIAKNMKKKRKEKEKNNCLTNKKFDK
jgi:hypothetical protein